MGFDAKRFRHPAHGGGGHALVRERAPLGDHPQTFIQPLRSPIRKTQSSDALVDYLADTAGLAGYHRNAADSRCNGNQALRFRPERRDNGRPLLKARSKLLIPRHQSRAPSSFLVGRRSMGITLTVAAR